MTINGIGFVFISAKIWGAIAPLFTIPDGPRGWGASQAFEISNLHACIIDRILNIFSNILELE